MNYHQRIGFINIVCDGNTLTASLHEPKKRYCSSCDCIDGHACLICEAEIEEELCTKRDGLCSECHFEKES